jgi:hypothetical protein
MKYTSHDAADFTICNCPMHNENAQGQILPAVHRSVGCVAATREEGTGRPATAGTQEQVWGRKGLQRRDGDLKNGERRSP